MTVDTRPQAQRTLSAPLLDDGAGDVVPLGREPLPRELPSSPPREGWRCWSGSGARARSAYLGVCLIGVVIVAVLVALAPAGRDGSKERPTANQELIATVKQIAHQTASALQRAAAIQRQAELRRQLRVARRRGAHRREVQRRRAARRHEAASRRVAAAKVARRAVQPVAPPPAASTPRARPPQREEEFPF
jgi:hypothetical protein